MKLKKNQTKMFILVFFLLFFIDASFAANIGCQFLNKPPFYQCIATTVDPVTFPDQAITVSGNHVSPYGNANVSYVQFADPQVINYFPSLLFNVFPNLEHIQMRKVKFTTFTTNAIRNCPALKYLYLYDNSISVLPSSFMSTCLNTMIINLQFNQISTVDKYAFNGLWYVRELNLAYNNIAYLDPSTFTFIGNLMEIYLSNNQITSIHPDTFASNTILQHVDLCNNKLTVLPAIQVSKSWTYMPGIYFSSNQIRAIDPSFLANYPGNRTNWILGLYDNICINKDFANEFPVQQGDLDACYNTWRTWNTTTVQPLTTVTTKLPTTLTKAPTTITTKLPTTLKQAPTTITTKLPTTLTQAPTTITTKLPTTLTQAPTTITTKLPTTLTQAPTTITTKLPTSLTQAPTTVTTLKPATSNINCQYKLTSNRIYWCTPISVDPITMENMNITTSGVPISGYNEKNIWEIDFISSWKINYVPSKMFAIYPNIEFLKIINSSLSNLTTNAFRNCSKLVTLVITDNNFPTIPASFAESCTSLRDLTLTNNRITTVDKNAFKGLVSLSQLGLEPNNIAVLDPSTFSFSPNIYSIGLGSNQITNIDPLLFAGLTRLGAIGLHSNKLTALGALQLPSSLTAFSLGNNQITATDPKLIDTLTSIFPATRQIWGLQFTNNICINKYYNYNNAIAVSDFATCFSNWRTLYKIANINCQYKLTSNGIYWCIPSSVDPITIENQEITTSGVPIFGYNEKNIWEIDFISSWKINYVPSKMFAIYPNIEFLKIINSSLSNLTTNAFRNCSKLVTLVITDNNFPAIPASFAESCTSLRDLTLRNNRITTVDKNAFKGLVSLSQLYLEPNNIAFLDPSTFSFSPNIFSIGFGNNMLTSIHPDTFLGLKSLTYLGLHNNKLRVLPAIKFGTNPTLYSVSLGFNQIISIDPLFISNYPLNRTSNSNLLLDSNLCINKQYVYPSKPFVATDFTACYNNFRNGVV